VKSLSGLRVGHFRNGTSELAFAMDKQYDLNIEWVPFLSHTNLYVSGAIDATLAMSYNELFQLKLAGQRIKPNQILRLGDMGYDVPEDGLYVTANYYRRHKAEIDKFAKATQKGWEWVAAHPDEALDIVMLYIQQNGIASNRISQEWMLKECIKLIADKKTGKRNYRLEPKSLELANRILCDNNIISKPITYKQITQP
jgi:NitT/TauT family transport system substrate-binding protein